MRTIKCCSVVSGVTLRLLVINISSPAINKLRRLFTISGKCHKLPRSGDIVLITSSRSQRWEHATKSDSGRQSRFLPTTAFDAPVSHDGWYGKTTTVWLPMVKKNWRYNYSFWQTDRRTDGHCMTLSIGHTDGRTELQTEARVWRQQVTRSNVMWWHQPRRQYCKGVFIATQLNSTAWTTVDSVFRSWRCDVLRLDVEYC